LKILTSQPQPNLAALAYNLLLHTAAPPVLALYYLPRVLWGGKYRGSLAGKLGRLTEATLPQTLARPVVWFHAVSVGEAVALSPMARQFKNQAPHWSVVVSTGTETGQAKARESMPFADGFLYLPLDFPASVAPVIRSIRPQLFVLMETELWPNLIRILKQSGAKIALANGRISDRSFPRYRVLRKLFAPTLEQIDLFLMSSELDRERISAMGANPHTVEVTGNTKVDAVLGQTEPAAGDRMRVLLDIPETTRTIVAGSTHPGEHEIVLDAFQDLRRQYPDLVLIIVPRHPDKTGLVVSAMRARGMPAPFLRSAWDHGERRADNRVVIIDRTGELFSVFPLASVVFMGGSLVPKGGQNILEPAAWGKVSLFGPSMEDFRDARDMLIRVGGGIQVRTRDDIAMQVRRLLEHPGEAKALGERARQETLRHRGSSIRNVERLLELGGQ
jgi:3-deoxy-D-manno-octulosonic-acid transferase